MSTQDAEALRQKILTADIFSSAEVDLLPDQGNSCHLDVRVSEKLTTIPVIRAAYGGGTPLVVLGGYNTNVSGKLYLLGAEIRRYGNLAPGMFLYAKSPRAFFGLGSFGSELWLDRRRRDFYTNDGTLMGHADSEAWTSKLQLLYPVNAFIPNILHWQVGVRTDLTRESAGSFEVTNNANQTQVMPGEVTFADRPHSTLSMTPILVYDDLKVDQTTFEGLRFSARSGLQTGADHLAPMTETEGFGYAKFPFGFNLAGHAFYGRSASEALSNLYFLGGFDSVRGLPDGIHYGQSIYYGNAEARLLAHLARENT